MRSKFYFRLGEFFRMGKEEAGALAIRNRTTLFAPERLNIVIPKNIVAGDTSCATIVVQWKERQ